jgi:hypothetical protein
VERAVAQVLLERAVRLPAVVLSQGAERRPQQGVLSIVDQKAPPAATLHGTRIAENTVARIADSPVR